MKHKLSEIINTDCYVQFDTNEQLREWVTANGIKIHGHNLYGEKSVYLMMTRKAGDMLVCTRPIFVPEQPVYHHTNISI
jgi:hypothetical protein